MTNKYVSIKFQLLYCTGRSGAGGDNTHCQKPYARYGKNIELRRIGKTFVVGSQILYSIESDN